MASDADLRGFLARVNSFDMGDGVQVQVRNSPRGWVVVLAGGYYLNKALLEWEQPHPKDAHLVPERYYYEHLDDALSAVEERNTVAARRAKARAESRPFIPEVRPRESLSGRPPPGS